MNTYLASGITITCKKKHMTARIPKFLRVETLSIFKKSRWHLLILSSTTSIGASTSSKSYLLSFWRLQILYLLLNSLMLEWTSSRNRSLFKNSSCLFSSASAWSSSSSTSSTGACASTLALMLMFGNFANRKDLIAPCLAVVFFVACFSCSSPASYSSNSSLKDSSSTTTGFYCRAFLGSSSSSKLRTSSSDGAASCWLRLCASAVHSARCVFSRSNGSGVFMVIDFQNELYI